MARFGTGKNTIGADETNFNARSKYKMSYSSSGVYRKKTVPVKSFFPNSLGLYDMSGIAWE
jgi:formylglycine-generating enzyme required for sulfatase activity|tara:strand:+ start:666 stop:848 length:183 start_codon:yes stop_codon:yes gene_type:complete